MFCAVGEARAQNLLQITSPADGTVVQQGTTISVTFSADSSVSNIALQAEFLGGFVGQTSAAGTFTLTIPSTTPIEEYQVYVIGTAGGQLVASPPISLIVDTPLSIGAIQTEPRTLQFDSAGDVLPLSVTGTLSDGSSALVTHSPKISFSSNNQNVATVDSRGNVTAVGPGSTFIVITGGSTPYSVYTNVPAAPLTVTCSTMNISTIGEAFDSPVMTVTGGSTPYTFSVSSGTLSAGLTLNTSTGAVSGIPTTPGTFTINVTDAHGTVGAGCPITINGGPIASVSPSSINFGTVYLGSIDIKNVTVTNTGTLPVTITDPFLSLVTGGDSNEFVQLNLCPKSLAAGQHCTIVVTFIAGPFYTPQTATLSVMDNAPGNPQTVPLMALVINPQARLRPPIVNFGAEKLDSSVTKTVTLENTGATSLMITSVAVTGANPLDFGSSSNCGSSLAAGNSCTISVTFEPMTTGRLSAILQITDNTRLGSQTVWLAGTGY